MSGTKTPGMRLTLIHRQITHRCEASVTSSCRLTSSSLGLRWRDQVIQENLLSGIISRPLDYPILAGPMRYNPSLQARTTVQPGIS